MQYNQSTITETVTFDGSKKVRNLNKNRRIEKKKRMTYKNMK